MCRELGHAASHRVHLVSAPLDTDGNVTFCTRAFAVWAMKFWPLGSVEIVEWPRSRAHSVAFRHAAEAPVDADARRAGFESEFDLTHIFVSLMCSRGCEQISRGLPHILIGVASWARCRGDMASGHSLRLQPTVPAFVWRCI
eukprot:NODE_19426_length_843_cov_7.143855.p4 GENE.NODE_19426_length_843_cov_7.143855~~NODE_19426_length_843_cov_7.143855.p4  ORF type:complete len:142 (+),score=7.92 NODE_19426_length_843_cov_7.143855:214-639(+)